MYWCLKTNEFAFFMAKKTHSFVGFLGESTAPKSAYGFIWPLVGYLIQFKLFKIQNAFLPDIWRTFSLSSSLNAIPDIYIFLQVHALKEDLLAYCQAEKRFWKDLSFFEFKMLQQTRLQFFILTFLLECRGFFSRVTKVLKVSSFLLTVGLWW